MTWVSLISLSVLIFATSNLDDLFILLGLFSIDLDVRSDRFPPSAQLSRRKKLILVFLGQSLGMLVLSSISMGLAWVTQATAPEWIRWMGLLPLGYGFFLIGKSEIKVMPEALQKSRFLKNGLRTSSWIWMVSLLTIGQGADNLSLYVPFFSKATPSQWGVIATVFFLMTGIWCIFADFLVNHERFGRKIRNYGRKIIPWVLIYVGLSILF
jgi:cadmium resistance protein CadD (predicted permease)